MIGLVHNSLNLMKKYIYRFMMLALLGSVVASCSKETLEPQPVVLPESEPGMISKDATFSLLLTPTRDNNMALGNPSGAQANSSYYWNYLMQKGSYTVSYHRDRGTPNWVSWHLSTAWLGSATRTTSFSSDASLPSGWYRVTSSSYTNTGFDRGHDCPSADRTYTSGANAETFLMTNIIPQAPIHNQQVWANLEAYCRKLVNEGNELYIIMGSYGRGGTGNNGYMTTIDAGRVTVPNRIWKVVVVLPVGSNDAARVTTSTRVIAVNIPNTNSVSSDWGGYRTTVDAIETAMGYNLLSNVATSVQDVIEARVDTGPTK
jgi:endonuclease G, mitochondrial